LDLAQRYSIRLVQGCSESTIIGRHPERASDWSALDTAVAGRLTRAGGRGGAGSHLRMAPRPTAL